MHRKQQLSLDGLLRFLQGTLFITVLATEMSTLDTVLGSVLSADRDRTYTAFASSPQG